MRLLLAMVVSLAVAARAFSAPVPSTALTTPPQPLIGEQFAFTVAFDNTSATDTGYGPFIDLQLPATGIDGAGAAVDDGITFVGASYLGAPVVATTLTFNASGNATHPYARTSTGASVVVTGTPGDQLVVLLLPFGSFTPAQPAAVVTVNAQLSNLADANAPLIIRSRGGFQLGADPLDNPLSDPSILGSLNSVSVTPTILRLSKLYVGPENETSTGPNYPRQYSLSVDIAAGQTITNLDLTDVLPPNLQFLSVDSTTVNGSPVSTTAVSTPSISTPGGTLTRRFASVTGTSSSNDATMTFTFFIPLLSATSSPVIDPISGDDVISEDDAKAQASWTPTDLRDPATTVTSDATPIDHTLTDKSIAIQKSVTVRTDAGATGTTPGDTLEYSLTFQISDYFAFQNLNIADVISDGQRIDPSFAPTLMVDGNGFSTGPSAFAAPNVSVVPNYTPASVPPNDGTTTINFAVSNELISRTFSGRAIGGCIPGAGTGGPAPDCAVYNDGPTIGTIVFRTTIQENFSDTFPSGDPSVDQGDTLANDVSASGDILQASDLAPTGQAEADTSTASVTILQGVVSKSIYAVNGSTSFTSPVQVMPGDTVTYRIQYSLPTSDFENLSFADFLPLPIFNATTVTTFSPTVSAAAPASGTAKYGPADTFNSLAGAPAPALSSDATSNSLAFNYGTYDNSGDPQSLIDLLFTVTVGTQPFTDQLFLTNQVQSSNGTTNAGTDAQNVIVQLQIGEPNVIIRKGIVVTDDPSAVFAPATVGPVTFSAPGSAGFRGSGTIRSSGLSSTPINSNVSRVDAGDLVTFAVVLENLGTSGNGAFDVRVKDTIPAGFSVPSGGLNLSVTDGTGAAMTTTDLGGGLLGSGLDLVDPGPTNPDAGALDRYSAASGRNIAVITYDLQVDSAVTFNQALTNTATLFNFSNIEGGTDFTSVDRTDPATATIGGAVLTKTVLATSESFTGVVSGTNRVAVGEIVRYRLLARVPEGSAPNLQLLDNLPTGITFLNDGTARGGLVSNTGMSSSTLGVSANLVGDDSNIASITPSFVLPDTAVSANVTTNVDTYNTGTDVYFKFGDVTNGDRDSNLEYVIVEFNALVDNSASANNSAGTTRNNNFTIRSGGAQVGGASGNAGVVIAEPSITNFQKGTANTTTDAGSTVNYSVTFSNGTGNNVTTAFDARITDTLPAGLTLNTGSVNVTVVSGTVTNNSAGNTVDVTINQVPAGAAVTITYSAVVSVTATPGQALTNTARLEYTSLPGTNGTAVNATGSSTPGLPGATTGERTGSGVAPNDNFATDPATTTLSSSTISGFVYFDANNNGSKDGGELGIPGVAVILSGTDHLGNAVNTGTTTGANGSYTFAALRPGTYSVSETQPAGYLDGKDAAGTQGGTAGNDVVSGIVLPLASNTSASNYNFGELAPASVSGFVYSDANNNGIKEGGESGVNGVTITLTGTDDLGASVNATVLTSGLGAYTFGNLRPGTYAIVETQPSGYFDGKDSPGTQGGSAASNDVISGINLTAGTSGMNNNFGELLPSSLSGFVYVDDNNNGLRESGESGVGSVTITLTGTDDLGASVSLTTTTDVTTGAYSFSSLRPGTYTIAESQPATFVDGKETAGTAGGSTATNDQISGIVLAPGVDASENNFGERTPVADLTLTKSVDNASPNVSTNVTFTLVLTNSGIATAGGITVSDLLPAGLTFVSANPSADYNSASGVWTVGSLADQATATLTITASVDSPGAITNTAEVAASSLPDPDSTPGNGNPAEDDQASVQINGLEADLSVTKTVDDASPNVGGNVTFTVTVANAGPSTATGVVASDLLPPTLTFVSSSQPGSYNSMTGVWTVGSIAPNASTALTITATVSGAAAFTNTVQVQSADLHDPDSTPNNGIPSEDDQASATGTPRQADLSLSKTVSNAAPNVGTDVIFTLTLSNAGPNTATNIAVRDLLPASLSYVSDSPSAGSYNSGMGIWSIPSLSAGTSATLQITATVTAFGSQSNVGEVIASDQFDPDSTPNNNNAAEDDQATAQLNGQQADLSLVKDVDNITPDFGSNVTYSVVLSNSGPNTATAVTVSDPLPTGVNFVSANPEQGTYNSGTGVWTVGSIAAGTDLTLQIVATVNSTLPVTNVAQVQSVNEFDPDSTPNNNVSTEDDQASSIITPVAADLSLVKTVSNALPLAGQNVDFVITVSNGGPSVATGVTVSDLLPAGLTFVSSVASQGGYDNATGVWTVAGPLAASASATLTITARVDAPGSLTNVAEVASSDQPDPDSTPGNNSPSEDDRSSVSLNGQGADLRVTKTVTPNTVVPSMNATFVLLVENLGTANATGVVLTDALPAGVSFVSATPSQGSCAGTSTVTCTLGSLNNGASATVSIVITAMASNTVVVNTATVSANEADPNPGNNSSSSSLSIGTPLTVDLSVTKTASISAIAPGGSFSYSIGVVNLGTGQATGVTVSDTLPAGLALISAVSSQGTCTQASPITCSVGTLGPGAQATITLQVRAVGSGPFENTATASAVETETTLSNNSATVAVGLTAAIPALSEWMLMLLAMLLAFVAVLRLTR